MLTKYFLIPLVFRRGLASNVCNPKGRTRKIRIKLPNGHYIGEHREGGYKVYQKLTFFVAFPILAAAMIHCYFGMGEQERPPFVKYEYLRRRTKRFPWGDGNKSFFHNPHMNALPDGYETVRGGPLAAQFGQGNSSISSSGGLRLSSVSRGPAMALPNAARGRDCSSAIRHV